MNSYVAELLGVCVHVVVVEAWRLTMQKALSSEEGGFSFNAGLWDKTLQRMSMS